MRWAYCTYFDSNYLLKGLALYRSLERYQDDFTLWILCFDEECYRLLTALDLPHARLLRREEFEYGDEPLRAAKGNRSLVEYYWTCTPSLPLYVLSRDPEAEAIAYLDADLFFFSSPRPMFEEMNGHSVLIVEHRFRPEENWKADVNGIYNVSVVAFRHNEAGLECMRWWRDRCNEWCYLRSEDGKLGDQKYLDDWPTRFPGVAVLRHPGGGIAPWNLSRFTLDRKGRAVRIEGHPLLFYHFHQFEMVSPSVYRASHGYRFDRRQIVLLYQPYARALRSVLRDVRRIEPSFPCQGPGPEGQSLLSSVIDHDLYWVHDPRLWLAR